MGKIRLLVVAARVRADDLVEIFLDRADSRPVDCKGSELVVKGISWRGTQTTDTFSLRGLEQALERGAQECQIPVAGDFPAAHRLDNSATSAR